MARKRRAASRGILRRVTHESASRMQGQEKVSPLPCLCILIASCGRNESFDPRKMNKRLNNIKCHMANNCIILSLLGREILIIKPLNIVKPVEKNIIFLISSK